MNDPATSPAPTLGSLDTRDDNFLEVYASSVTWQQAVDFYKVALESLPNPAGPPVAVFQLAAGIELRVIQTDDRQLLDKQAAGPIWHVPVRRPEQVQKTLDDARNGGAQIVLPVTTAWAFPLPNQPNYQAIITLGIIRLRSGQQAAPDGPTLGVIHNPNWFS